MLTAVLLGRTALARLRPLRGRLTSAEGWILSYAVGAALLSTLMFCLCAVGWVFDATIVAVGAAVAPCWLRWGRWAWPSLAPPQAPVHWTARLMVLVPAAVYGGIYAVHTLAPETRWDAMGYHLGLVHRYYRDHGFVPITTNVYAHLSQGTEMLYLFAYSIGRESAAKLVHLSFLAAACGAVLCLARRLRAQLAGVFAAVVFFTCPVVIPDASSAYNDIALAFALLMVFYTLAIWWQDRVLEWIVPLGLLVGFSFAVKYTGVVAIAAAGAAAAAALASTRKAWPSVKILGLSAAGAAAVGMPWLVKNAAFTGNPLAPFFNALFRNPFVSVEWEQAYLFAMKSYREGPLDRVEQLASAPFDLVMGERYAGSLGWLLLLAPISLLALKRPLGRALLGSAFLCALPWLSNAGARFLIPSVLFGVFALGLVVDSLPGRLRMPVLAVLLTAQCVTSWPPSRAFWYHPDVWTVVGLPWRAALRLEPQKWHLARRVEFFLVADRLDQIAERDTRVLSLFNLPEAYFKAELLVSFQGLENQDLADALLASTAPEKGPNRLLRASWAPQAMGGIRVEQRQPLRSRTWRVSDVRLLRDGVRFSPPAASTLDAFPHPWHAGRAFDGDPFSTWNSREPPAAGMFVEARFESDVVLDGLEIVHPGSASRSQSGIRIRGLAPDGEWRNIRPAHVELVRAPVLAAAARQSAGDLLRKHRIRYVVLTLDPDSPYYQESRTILTSPADWDLRRIFVDRSAVLLEVQPAKPRQDMASSADREGRTAAGLVPGLPTAEVVAEEPRTRWRVDRPRILADVKEAATDHRRAPCLPCQEQPGAVKDLRARGREIQPEQVTVLSQREESAVDPQQVPAIRTAVDGACPTLNPHRLLPLERLSPHSRSVRGANASQHGIRLVAARKRVEMTALVQRCRPVQVEFRVLPDLLVPAIVCDSQQGGAGPVGGRDEDRVIHHYRAGRVDRFVAAAAPGETELQPAVSRVDCQQASCRGAALAAGQNEGATPAVHFAHDRRGIARAPLVAGAPEHPSGQLVEGRDRGPSGRTDVQDESVRVENRVGSRSEEVLGNAELGCDIAPPDQLACP